MASAGIVTEEGLPVAQSCSFVAQCFFRRQLRARVRAPRASALSELRLQSELPVSRLRHLGSHDAKRPAGRRRIGDVEARMVQRVVTFGAELNGHALLDLVVLDQRETPRRLAIRADSAELGRETLNVVRELLCADLVESGVDVEPLVGGPLTVGERDVLDIAREQGIAEAERRGDFAELAALTQQKLELDRKLRQLQSRKLAEE